MGKKFEGAIKGGLAAAPISLGYSLADNPGGGLLATGLAMGIGATVAAAKRRNPNPGKKSQFVDAHGKAVGFKEATKWGDEL